jgi:hypothetical protein
VWLNIWLAAGRASVHCELSEERVCYQERGRDEWQRATGDFSDTADGDVAWDAETRGILHGISHRGGGMCWGYGSLCSVPIWSFKRPNAADCFNICFCDPWSWNPT